MGLVPGGDLRGVELGRLPGLRLAVCEFLEEGVVGVAVGGGGAFQF